MSIILPCIGPLRRNVAHEYHLTVYLSIEKRCGT